MDYREAGVDIEAGYRAVDLMKEQIEKTSRPEVVTKIGGFSGGFSIAGAAKMKNPVLLSATDGVGTKLAIAVLLDRHDTIGIDCVAMCVNDLICAGAEPLFFQDYIACGKNEPEKMAKIVSGVAEGCVMSGAALVGGETAEHPGLMPEQEYDLAGFAVGIADEEDLITGKDCKEGDLLIGLTSSGVHSNGFSLIRKIFPMTEESMHTYYEELSAPLGDVLLTPTRIYVKALKALKEAGISLHGCSHITGGGFYENIPRMLPDGLRAVIDLTSFPVLPIFRLIEEKGNVKESDMFHTYNMGIGMVLAIRKEDGEEALRVLKGAGETPYVIGSLQTGERGVVLC